jgi:hypothetical protein
MMPRRERDPMLDWKMPTVETGAIEMLARDNARMREAGCNLAEAAARVVRDYDGLHRLSIAISAWFTAIASEGDRGDRHASGIDARSGETRQGLDPKDESPPGRP